VKIFRFAAVVPLLLFCSSASAQVGVFGTPLQIAPIATFDFGSPLFINRKDTVFHLTSDDGGGTSTRTSYGLGVDVGLPSLFSKDVGIAARILGVYSAGTFRSGFDSVITGYDVTAQEEAALAWDISPFIIRAGGWLSQRIKGKVFENGVDVTSDNTQSLKPHVGILAGVDWNLSPVTIELNSQLDLGEIENANIHALSMGIAVSLPLGSTRKADDTMLAHIQPAKRPAFTPARVRFLVNRSEIGRTVSLQRMELRVKEYEMIDSANIAPKVRQWISESYHLPHLAVACEIDREAGGELKLSKLERFSDARELWMGTLNPVRSSAVTHDTTIDLDRDTRWQTALASLSISEQNAIVAELREANSAFIARDTLVLPAVDTARGEPIVKKQFRFILSDRFDEIAGQTEALDLLLERMKSLLDPSAHITVHMNREHSANPKLTERVTQAIGKWDSVTFDRGLSNKQLVVVIEL
jgi:hypothetical protein